MEKIEKKVWVLDEVFKAINDFNESVALNFYRIKNNSFKLKYCKELDTLHSFRGEECYNCSFKSTKNLLISPMNFSDFTKYFGEGFLLKIIELVDNWPKRNRFPYTNTDRINRLPEHKRLEEVLLKWGDMTEEEKADQIIDLYEVQEKYAKLQERIAAKGL